MSIIKTILDGLFQNNGINFNLWVSLKNIVQNKPDEIVPFCFIIKSKINSGVKSDILLAFTILDFAVDSGRLLLWEKIDNKEFLSYIVNILKTKSDPDLQNTALYLIQKWAIKFQSFPSLQNCNNIFISLKNNNIYFPNYTKNLYQGYLAQGNYNKYNIMNNNNINNYNRNINNNNIMNNNANNYNRNINNNNINYNNNNINYNRNLNYNNNNIINNINNNMNNNINFDNLNKQNIGDNQNNNSLRQSRIPSNPNDYIQNINLDLNINSYEKKYQKLVNKLNDWIYAIQEINVLIDNNTNFQNNSKLKFLCDDLKSGYQKLVETIQGTKLNNEILMQISLNVSEDMIMTLNRYEKSIKGENPGPFLSSFTRDDNPNLNKFANKDKNNIEQNDFKYKDPLEKIGKLGFGDTILTQYMDDDENINNNSLNNDLSDLFEKNNKSQKLDVSQKTNVDTKIDEMDFFTNKSNSDNEEDNQKNHNDNSKSLVLNKTNIYGKIADNNDIKRLINNNYAYENEISQSQRLPIVHMNINDGLYNNIISKTDIINNGKNKKITTNINNNYNSSKNVNIKKGF